MSKKISYEVIKASFEKEGYTLLTQTYENNRQKLEYICKRGHHYSIRWTDWNSKEKHRGPHCNDNVKLNIEFIRTEFAKEGYTLLTKVYENNKQKLEYICPRGHRHFMTWSHWRKGIKCPCFSNLMKPTIEFIRKKFEKDGFTLLTKIYENNQQKLEYICPEGHRHSVSWGHCGSLKKIKCAYCSKKVKKNIEFIRAEFAKEGYILLTTVYKNAHTKLDYICPEGHRHSISWSNWKKGERCPFCNNGGVSKWEKTVKNFLGESNIDYVSNDKTQLINPKTGCSLELDIWLPKLNKAIECNGLYWHEREEAIARDKIKKQLCKDQGIDLLVITDEEWKDDTDKCKKKIQDFLLVRQFISTKEIKKETGIKNEQ